MSLDSLYANINDENFTPGWVKREKPVLYSEPRPEYLPAHWRYLEARAGLDVAGALIDVSLAERRNFIMRNPSPSADFETSRTLVCAYQMILPGEMAPSHRHSSHALRVIIEGEGTYSIVNGEKMPMETGDVVLTPGWCWHGHGHGGDRPAYWFDGLDVPLTRLLEPVFYQDHPQKHEAIDRVTETSPFRFKRDELARRIEVSKSDPEGIFGKRIYLDTSSMPTLSVQIQQFLSGTITRAFRATANYVFLVMEGTGCSVIGNQTFHWQRGDTFVAPGWFTIQHKPATDTQFFVLSDEPVFKFAGYYRQEAF